MLEFESSLQENQALDAPKTRHDGFSRLQDVPRRSRDGPHLFQTASKAAIEMFLEASGTCLDPKVVTRSPGLYLSVSGWDFDFLLDLPRLDLGTSGLGCSVLWSQAIQMVRCIYIEIWMSFGSQVGPKWCDDSQLAIPKASHPAHSIHGIHGKNGNE